MKIIYRKNKLVIKLVPFIKFNFNTALLIYCAIALLLMLIFPVLLIPLLIIGALFIDLKGLVVLDPRLEKIVISKQGIKFKGKGKNTKSYDKQDIKRLYIQEINGELQFYINYNDKISFHIQNAKISHSIVNKIKKLLNLKITNTKKTSTGKVMKLVNKDTLAKNENHIEAAKIVDSYAYVSQSEFYNVHALPKEVKISTTKNVGFHNVSKLIIDKESRSLKIHLFNSNPGEVFFDQIDDLEVSIHQNASGEKGDLVEGKIILNSAQYGPITIFHCNVKEENQLDFTADHLEKDLIALKAIIEFEIYNTIDQNLETLDLDSHKKSQEKSKDILPNGDWLES